jgi:hypothetical protein
MEGDSNFPEYYGFWGLPEERGTFRKTMARWNDRMIVVVVVVVSWNDGMDAGTLERFLLWLLLLLLKNWVNIHDIII